MGRRGRRPHPDILTPREWEVLDLLRERLTNEQIAEHLGITLDGAKYHVSEILSKLGVRTREEASAWTAAEARPWWQRLIALPVGAKAAGALTIVAAAAGLAVLAWGVVQTGGPPEQASSGVGQSVSN
jgi:DNA-binding CsgD family transcriptional regulator